MGSQISKSDRAFINIAYILLSITFLVILLPILNLIAVSLSDQTSVISGEVIIWPKGLNFKAYNYVLSGAQFYSSFRISILITIAGTLIGVILSMSAAYPLSKKGLPYRNVIMVIFIFTTMFNGGIIPQYLLIQRLGLLNTIWSVIFPMVSNVFNLLIVKNYLETIPSEIEESAKIDGASQLTILLRIILPIAIPVIATVSLFFAVAFWNDYFNPNLYITKQSMLPLQVYLRRVIFDAMDPLGNFALDSGSMSDVAAQSIVNATIILSMLPIVIVYPFLQRFFIQGIIIGSVKG